jgi:UDP-4-amino-4-deoxy-L-arabinose-oxoglutarate aminotransferase
VDAFDREGQGRAPQAEVLEPGYKYNITDIASILGLGQLARLDEFNRRRAELAARYRERLSEVEEILPLSEPAWPMRHAWHLFVARLDTDRAGMDREAFMTGLKARNVGTGIHFRAVHTHRYYRKEMGFRPGMLPNTEWNSERICSLPLFPAMTEEDVDSVIDVIKAVLR